MFERRSGLNRSATVDSDPSWLSFPGYGKDGLWSVDLFRCESLILMSRWLVATGTRLLTRRSTIGGRIQLQGREQVLTPRSPESSPNCGALPRRPAIDDRSRPGGHSKYHLGNRFSARQFLAGRSSVRPQGSATARRWPREVRRFVRDRTARIAEAKIELCS